MTSTVLLRSLAWIVLASLAGASEAGAQSDAEEEAPEEGIVDATWVARRAYHRQLRRVDLSELGSAAGSVSLGAYALRRDAPFTRGLGGATLAGGGVHLISGIVFTIRSQRGMRPEQAPDEFREGDPYARELAGAERHSDLFIAYLTTDASIITAGLTTALAGVARDRQVVQGVGIGLASQGVLTLLLDLLHQDQGRRYLRALRRLDPRLTVLATPGGSTAVASVSWTR